MKCSSNFANKKDNKLTKPHSPTLLTKNRLRRECDFNSMDKHEKKNEKDQIKHNSIIISKKKLNVFHMCIEDFVFKKCDLDNVPLVAKCFENNQFKARKIPRYKFLEIKKSEKECVVPIGLKIRKISLKKIKGFKLKTEEMRRNKFNKENFEKDSYQECKSLDKNSCEKSLKTKEKRDFNGRYSLLYESKNFI